MTDGTKPDVDVAIVGAGPVGLVLGILLAQNGRSVTIIEQWPTPYSLPRAVHFDHEVGRIIQSCGIGEKARAISEPAEVYEWQNASGETLLRFGRVGFARSGWPFSSMFCQPELETSLTERAAALPNLTMHRGRRLRSIEQSANDVELTCVSIEIGPDSHLVEVPTEVSTIRSHYVVGCDGANSTVRDLIGVEMDDRGFFYDWLIVDVILDDASRVFDPLNLQICDPLRPTTAVSGGPGRRRWEFMRLPDESNDELTQESRAWELLEPWDVTPSNARLERHAVYTFQARVAQEWQAHRVLLAGDAAHQMPPFAGQGMCSGVRDAANLGWKLDLVLGGHATSDLLATYGEERRPSASAAVDLSIELGKVICVPDPDEAAARDEAMAAGFDGSVSEAPDAPGITGRLVQTDLKRAGELFPQGNLDGRWFDDVYGAGFRLVTVDETVGELDTDLVDWFTTIGGKTVDVRSESSDLASWFDTNDVGWALQRPDFYLYGTAHDLRGATSLLRDLRSGLDTNDRQRSEERHEPRS